MIIGIGISFIIVARNAIFGSQSFSEIDPSTFIITTGCIIVFYGVVTILVSLGLISEKGKDGSGDVNPGKEAHKRR